MNYSVLCSFENNIGGEGLRAFHWLFRDRGVWIKYHTDDHVSFSSCDFFLTTLYSLS